MTLHMGVVAVAAPLLALALAGSGLDPVRAAPRLFSAVPAAIVELGIVWGWHAPALHHAARASTPWLVLEQTSFLGAGLWLWFSSFGGEPRAGARAGSGVVALLLTSMHMTLLGALLALAPRPLYHGARAGLPSESALADQHLGGAIMLLVGGTVYLAGGLCLSRRLLTLHDRQEVA
jgi:putative membrane protein